MTIPSFERNPATQRLIDRLIEVPIGGTITHDAMTKAAKVDAETVRQSAFRACERDHGVVFGNIRGVGYKRLAVDQMPSLGPIGRQRARNAARKARKSIIYGLAKANDIPNEVIKRSTTEIAHLGIVEEFTRDRAAPKMENLDKPLSVAATAKAMMQRLTGK